MSTVWSVIIPTFHRHDLLKVAVASCQAQSIGSGLELEIIVVDNSPAGDAETICKALDRGNLRYFHEPRTGLAFARNRGIDEAVGEYIAFLDDDETATSSWIEELNHAFHNSNADVVFGKVCAELEHPTIDHYDYITNFFTRDLKLPALSDVITRLNFVGTGNSAYRREVCFGQGLRVSERFNLSGGEDIDLFYKLKTQGCQFAWAPDAIVKEWVPGERATLTYLKERRRSQGQQRVDSMWRAGGVQSIRVPLFMVGGGIQAGVRFGLYVFHMATGRRELAREDAVEVQGGIGKILWMSASNRRHYGGEDLT